MDLNEVKGIFNQLNLKNQLTLDDIPEIDLYMDQVIQLFDGKFSESKRNEEDKALTKTMINNYAKGKLLMSIKNKKYSKEHLILMSLIYNLKGGLSIADIKTSLDKIVGDLEDGEGYPIRGLYKLYLEQYKEDLSEVEKSIEEKVGSINNSILKNKNLNDIGGNTEENSSYSMDIPEEDNKLDEFEKNFLLLSSLINMSNMYRRMGEKLIDDYFSKI